MVTPRGRKWTPEEDQRLSDMKAAGRHPHKIAKELDRTEAAVLSRIRGLHGKSSKQAQLNP